MIFFMLTLQLSLQMFIIWNPEGVKYTPTDCFFGDFTHWDTFYFFQKHDSNTWLPIYESRTVIYERSASRSVLPQTSSTRYRNRRNVQTAIQKHVLTRRVPPARRR